MDDVAKARLSKNAKAGIEMLVNDAATMDILPAKMIHPIGEYRAQGREYYKFYVVAVTEEYGESKLVKP